MVSLIGEYHAIEDLIYHLDGAMRKGNMEVGEYLRQIRNLGHEEFLIKCHISKIQRIQVCYLIDLISPSTIYHLTSHLPSTISFVSLMVERETEK